MTENKMSSLGFHAEHARDKRPRVTSSKNTASGSQPTPSLQPPPPQQQHYSTYSRSAFVRGSTIGDTSRNSVKTYENKSTETNFVESDPPGLNTFTIGGVNKKKLAGKSKQEKQPVGPIPPEQLTWRGTRRAVQRIEESAIKKREESMQLQQEVPSHSEIGELRETIDHLRLDLSRETLARKELNISIKSILSEMDELRGQLRGDEEDGSLLLEAEKVQREFRDVMESWSDKFNHFEKDITIKNETILKEVESLIREKNENVSSQVEHSLKQLNDMLYWYYGVVKKPDGIDIVSKEDGIGVLHKAKYGETLLLQPPMEKSDDGSIKMSCRMVDETGQPSIGEVDVAKNDTIFVSSFSMAPPR